MEIGYLRVDIDENMTWAALNQKIRQDTEVENSLDAWYNLYVVGPYIPDEKLLIYTASADDQWLWHSPLRFQCILYHPSRLDDEGDNIFRKLDPTDHSWRLLAFLRDPSLKHLHGEALLIPGQHTIPLYPRTITVFSCIANAQDLLGIQWGGYSIKEQIKRVERPPPLTPPIFLRQHVIDQYTRIQRAALLSYRQFSLLQRTFTCCAFRGDGFVGKMHGQVLPTDCTWRYLLQRFPGNVNEGSHCRIWPAPTLLMHPSVGGER
jgi:hypothetical protein